MEPVYLKHVVDSNSSEPQANGNAPLSFLEWKLEKTNLPENQAGFHYGQYLLTWFRSNREASLSKEFLTKQKYLFLLDQLQMFFTDKERSEWYNKINLANEKELLLAIPYFATRLKNICLYYLKLRKKLKSTKLKYNTVGTSLGIEQEIYNLLLETFTTTENESVEALMSDDIKNTLVVQTEDLYDDKDYFDKSLSVDPSQYYNFFYEPTKEYYSTKGITLSSGEWLFQSLSLSAIGNIDQYINNLTETILETPDSALYKQYIEKYLSENKTFTSFSQASSTIDVKEIPLDVGSNYFYYPGVKTDPSVFFDAPLSQTPLSSLKLTGSTSGTTLEDSDTIFIKNGTDVKGAWLKSESHKKENKTLKAKFKQNSITKFIFPHPGYGLSGENTSWTGPSIETEPQYEFLSNELKFAINEAYWNKGFTNDQITPIYINSTTLALNGATPSDNPKHADQLFIIEYNNKEADLPAKEKEGAWLFKTDMAAYPVLPEKENVFLWPYQLLSATQQYPEHLVSQKYQQICDPISIKNMDIPCAIGSNDFKTADKIYKLNNFTNTIEQATECCWLSSGILASDTHKYFSQFGFSATFAPEIATRFVWTGPSMNINDVFKTTSHHADCPFITNTPTISAHEWNKCTCKQVYYNPFGHPGRTVDDYNRLADLVIEDIKPSTEPFNLSTWKDLSGNTVSNSKRAAWYKTQTSEQWGNGSWVSSDQTGVGPLALETGKAYFYVRASSKTKEMFPPLIVNTRFPSFNANAKWMAAKKTSEGDWVTSQDESTFTVYPGDFLKYDRVNQTTSYVISSQKVENEGKNIKSIWSTLDYLVKGTFYDTTYIFWPTDERQMGNPNSSQYPPFKFYDLEALYWWEITHTKIPSLTQKYFSETVKVSSTVVETKPDPNVPAGDPPRNISEAKVVVETKYLNKTIFSFTPPVTGEYRITVSAKPKGGNPQLITTIPNLTVDPQYKDEELLLEFSHPSSGMLIEQPLYGWNYETSRIDSLARGAKPYWASLYFDKNENTKFKGVKTWGYPSDYLEGYLPNHMPKISPILLQYGTVINYSRNGYAYTWEQPIEFETFTNVSRWCKIISDDTTPTNLKEIYSTKDRPDLTVLATSEDSDIMLSNVINGFPVEVTYFANNTFTWSLSNTIIQKFVLPNKKVLYSAADPIENLNNRFFPTIATVPMLDETYSEADIGGYLLPQNTGASVFVNKDFQTFLKDQTNTNDFLSEDTNIHIGGRGRSQQDQPSRYDWIEQNQWMKEPSTSGTRAGSVKSKLTNTLQTLVPYEENSSETSLGVVDLTTKLTPWGGKEHEDWIDETNEPRGFTGILNVPKWSEDQLFYKTRNYKLEHWTSDIYGNQFSFYKPLTSQFGELWVKCNSGKIDHAQTALSAVFDKFKHSSFYNDLTSSKILHFENFYDTLLFQTPTAVALASITYDYDNEKIETTSDSITIVNNLSPSMRFEGSWLFSKTKEVCLLFTQISTSVTALRSFTPALYKLNLNDKTFVKIFPVEQESGNDLNEGLGDIKAKTIDKPVFSFNSLKQSYFITYKGSDINNNPFLVNITIESNDKLKVTEISRYFGSNVISSITQEPEYPPSVDLNKYSTLTAKASSSFGVKIFADNNPTKWTPLFPWHKGVMLDNSGYLSGKVFDKREINLLYEVTNSAGSVVYPFLLKIT